MPATALSETPDDAELLRRTAAGDRAAFDDFVVRHRAAVYRFARAASHSASDAEDALQDAFLAAYHGAHTFAGRATVRSWLFVITRREAWRRRAAALPEPITDADDHASWATAGRAAGFASDDPETLVLGAERRAALARALASLTAEDREILVLRELEDLSGEETAEALGLGLAAMKSRLHRARLRLAAALRQPGLGDDS